jgi:prepilin peptidase CpaA
MVMYEKYFLIGAVVVACVGGISDLRNARIPNWLTYSGLLMALILRFGLLGWSGFKGGVFGLFIAGLLFFVLFVIGAMGGGDTKLMAAVGAWSGDKHVFTVLLAATLAGGVLAIIAVISGHRLRSTLRNMISLIRFRVTSGLHPHPVLNVSQPGTLRAPFGVAIAMGTLICAGNAFWWR